MPRQGTVPKPGELPGALFSFAAGQFSLPVVDPNVAQLGAGNLPMEAAAEFPV